MFDQFVDLDVCCCLCYLIFKATLKTIRFSTDPKGQLVHSGARLCTKNEIAEDKKVSLILDKHEYQEGKYLVFTTTKPFPRSSKVAVKVGPIV